MYNNYYSTLYEMFANFQRSYYGKKTNHPMLTTTQFKSIAPLVVIHSSRQKETLNRGPVEVRVEFNTGSNIPVKTSAYCLILHDCVVQYNASCDVLTTIDNNNWCEIMTVVDVQGFNTAENVFTLKELAVFDGKVVVIIFLQHPFFPLPTTMYTTI